MLKRYRNLPQVGAGLLGLALVLAFSLTAQAASLRRSGTQSQGGVMFGVPAGASPALTGSGIPPVVQEFSLAGSGSVNFSAPASDCIAAGLVCNAGESCQCVEDTGNVTDGVGSLYHGSAFLILNIVTSFPTRQYPNGNNVGQACFFATGVLSVTPAASSTITFITSGAACNGIAGGVALYSGGFDIGPSSGGFSAAVGSGVLGFGSNFNTDVGIFDLRGAGTGLN
jgi:hypothetical protein